jgi:DNA replication initiation complex subunit (GINS family)
MSETDEVPVDIEPKNETENLQVKFADKGKTLNITIQTIQDLTRTESTRTELQTLDKTFFGDLVGYINEKKALVNVKGGDDLFSSTEKENTKLQLDNIQHLLDKLYDKRERKIINMAIDKSRVGDTLIDTSIMLEEEKELFVQVGAVLEKFRQNILWNIKAGKLPTVITQEMETVIPDVKKQDGPLILVRFLSAVPKFVGKNLETIGPFEEEDVANLSKEVADVLISKGRAEKIDEGM